MTKGLGWVGTLWAMVDERLADLSAKLQGVVRLVRVARIALWLLVLIVLASPVVLFLWPRYFPIAYAVSTLILVIPIVILAILAGLPLKMRSVVRLIDKGYPENAKELAIRVMARKLHDQSIATEELLVDTALNEARKLKQRYEAAQAQAAQATAEAASAGSGASGMDPPGAPTSA